MLITVMAVITEHPSREKIKFEGITRWLILNPLCNMERIDPAAAGTANGDE